MTLVPGAVSDSKPDGFRALLRAKRYSRQLLDELRQFPGSCASCRDLNQCQRLYDYLVDNLDSGTESRKRGFEHGNQPGK